MQITEAQLSKFKKYSSVLLSNYSKVVTLISVSDKSNGWDASGTAHVEIMWDGNIEQEEYSASSILGNIKKFQFENRDLDTEYNQFLLDLDSKISRCESDLVELQTPETSRYYKNKNKTFIAKSKRNNRKIIKYIKNLTK
mgnify:CR=1 FL=1|tara:strand:- start:169 stop:588 length:420 start_codon:yes stop_codon:yes gene_type:complete